MSGFSDMMMEDGYSDEMDYMDSLELEYLESCNDDFYQLNHNDDFIDEDEEDDLPL